ncbi:unnamed protein product, partial [Tenebrio molitor]
LTSFERGRIVGLKEAGCSYRQISGIMNHDRGTTRKTITLLTTAVKTCIRSVSTVVKCWQAWSVENRDSCAQGSGRPRRTTDRQDRHFRFLAFRDRHITTSSVATAWYNVMGRLFSMPTIYRRIRSWGLHSYRLHLVLPLTREHPYSVERHVARTVGVMVWGAISYRSRSPLIFIQGSMNARRYVQEVLQLLLVPYVQDIPNGL